jgi:cyclic pyranopterin phosphate synthase
MPGRDAVRDSHGREIDYLRLSVTDRCNLRCIYCMPGRGVDLVPHGDVLRNGEMIRLVRLLMEGLGIAKVRVTGGEPLVRKGLAGLVAGLAELSPRQLTMTTNGVLLAGRAGELAEAGLQRVNVSLDSLREKRLAAITRSNAGLRQVLDGIGAAGEAGLEPVRVNCVVLRGVNDDEVADFLRFGMDSGLEVRFIEHMPARLPDRMLFTLEEILERAAGVGAVEPLPPDPCATARRFRLDGGYVFGVIAPFGADMCSSCRRVRLTATGCLHPCLGRSDHLDLRRMLRGGASDAGIIAAARRAVMEKPASHGGCGRIRMWRMGG